MAFCKHCGTQYPDGGSCTNPACPGAQQAAAPAGNAFDGGFNEAMDKVKKNSGLIIGAIAAFVVLIIAIVFIANHTGAKGAANKYAKNVLKKNGFKNVSKVTMLDDAYKEYKGEDEFDDAKDAHKDGIETLKDNDCKFKIKSVKKAGKLNKKELKWAKNHFKDQAEKYDVDDDIEIKKGYEYKVKVKSKVDGDKSTSTFKIWVVKVKGDGWKVIDREGLAKAVLFVGALGDLDIDDSDYDFDFDF